MEGSISLDKVVNNVLGYKWDEIPLSYKGIIEFLRRSFLHRSVKPWSVFCRTVNTFFNSLFEAFYQIGFKDFSDEKSSEESEESPRKARKKAKKRASKARKRAKRASKARKRAKRESCDHQLIVLKMLNNVSKRIRKKLQKLFEPFIAHASEPETEAETWAEAEAETETETEALETLLREIYIAFCLSYRAGLYKAFYEYTKKS